ncbi:uncharacterized protein EV422DRAFT_620277 [Fimicolochytrium jonesii]|uniref:uncharacterized protein n=1 Tax=Fimicolochytrium jonesii TaxID=1396493 RepID=UPI0022FE7B7C|nr:uncharacterized protein EV422DRAFT_620277 [Fimicolochytrium jonesii]KAI8820862.1 hypothetical protein EV422DRAFT_620277 [Fimicolochytrium jonesii]
MGLNYKKWDNLPDYSSSSSSSSEDDNSSAPSQRRFVKEKEKVAATLRLEALAAADGGRPKGVLLAVPWDSHCEAVRWALDRHGISYVEESLPWGLHIWATLGYSDPTPRPQQLKVPVFKSGKGEVLKRSPTDIYTYLFAHSLSSTLRLFTPPSALDLQTYFDTRLHPAARIIFLSTILPSPTLSQKYILDVVHLNTWRTLAEVTWPVMRVWLGWCEGVWTVRGGWVRDVEAAWRVVEEVFERVGEELDSVARAQPISTAHTPTTTTKKHKPKKPYIAAPHLTAADITFAAHCIPVLFPSSQTDTFAENLTLLMPSLSELPPHVRARVRTLRETSAGRHAIRMWRRERGGGGGRVRASRWGRGNNPWWVKGGAEGVVWGVARGAGVAAVVFVGVVWVWGLVVAICAAVLVGLGAAGGAWYACRGTVVEERVRQIWFVLFGTPETTTAPAAAVPKLPADAQQGKTNSPMMGGDTSPSAAAQPTLASIKETLRKRIAGSKSPGGAHGGGGAGGASLNNRWGPSREAVARAI